MRQSEASEIVGLTGGRYQWFLFFLLCLSKLFVGVQICLPVITEMSQESADAAAEFNAGNLYFKNVTITSATTEWNLSPHITEASKSLFWVGVIIGNSFLGNLADKHGRKKMFFIDFVANIIISSLIAFSPHWLFYVFGRFLTGIVQGGMFVTVFTYGNELFDKSMWAITGCVINASWGFGLAFCGYMGYVIPDWRRFMVITSLPFLPLACLIYYLVPESPAWLYSIGRYEESELIYREFARKNGRWNWHMIESLGDDSGGGGKKFRSQTVAAALKNKEYRRRMKRICGGWFLCGITAYYLTYAADHLGGTVYQNIAFQGIVEFPIDILIALAMSMFNRRPLLLLFWILNIIMLLFLAIAPSFLPALTDPTSFLKLVFAMTAKGAIAACFTIVWVWSQELFPTSLRASSVGLGSMCARFGAMLSPFLFELGEVVPFYVLAGGAVFVSYYNFGLPETFRVEGLNRLEDMKTVPEYKMEEVEREGLIASDSESDFGGGSDGDSDSDAGLSGRSGRSGSSVRPEFKNRKNGTKSIMGMKIDASHIDTVKLKKHSWV